MKIKFRSAIDGWFYLTAILLPLALIVIIALSIKSANLIILVVLGASAFISLVLPWALFTTHYIFDSGKLKIRSGPFFKVILLSDIKAVKPCRSALSSPALSLNRLAIQYGQNRTILVSPKDMEGFRNAISLA